MKSIILGACCLGTALALLGVGSVPAVGAQALPVPSQGLARPVPDAQEVPDAGQVYKVMFDVSAAGPRDKVHPALATAARYLNTLAEYGVPPTYRKIVIVLHGDASQFALKKAAFAALNAGKPNPDAALIDQLINAGVDVHVCGQDVIAKRIAPEQLLPGVKLDLWALSTLVNLQLRGYAHVGGG